MLEIACMGERTHIKTHGIYASRIEYNRSGSLKKGKKGWWKDKEKTKKIEIILNSLAMNIQEVHQEVYTFYQILG